MEKRNLKLTVKNTGRFICCPVVIATMPKIETIYQVNNKAKSFFLNSIILSLSK